MHQYKQIYVNMCIYKEIRAFYAFLKEYEHLPVIMHIYPHFCAYLAIFTLFYGHIGAYLGVITHI